MYSCLRPFLPPIYRHVYDRLTVLVRESKRRTGTTPRILDVGGRKSHYTIGLDAKITISELPRESDVQKQLHLGITDQMAIQTRKRRSNIETIVYDDMVNTRLPRESYDIVVAIEVLEHVEADSRFVMNVFSLLRPGGSFLMTTPNGDYVTDITNPDHKRHYRREQLVSLLLESFPETEVYYAVKGSRFREWGLRSWSPKHPITTLRSMVGNYINWRESMSTDLANQPQGTHHLVAIARKSDR